MENLITINIIAFNEKIMLPFIIDHYEAMFSKPKFVVYNNNSTDETKQIALDRGCKVIDFDTDGMNDTIHAKLKTNAIFKSDTDWVLCIDCDEACLITEKDLIDAKFNAVHFKGWEIFDEVDSPYKAKNMGVQSVGYSKPILFKKECLMNLEFTAGAHQVKVTPRFGYEMRWSKDEYNLLHYKHWSFNYSLPRSEFLATRQSQDNLKHRHSFHFSLPYDVHKDYYENGMKNRIQIEDPRLELRKK